MRNRYKVLWALLTIVYWAIYLEKISLLRFIFALLVTLVFIFLLLANKQRKKGDDK